MNWYDISISEVLNELSVEKHIGISTKEAQERLAKYGKNELKQKEKKSIWIKLFEQFKDPMILILIGASLISAAMGEVTDAIIIIAIVLINATLSLYQEGKAEEAIEALQKMASPHAKVLRDGNIIEINSEDIVIGDIVELETGDIIPADVRLIESSNLKIDESSLTGESVPAEKFASKVFKKDIDIGIGDRANMGYSSCTISYGRAMAVVVETGRNTEIGKIATTIQSYEEEMTPLQKKLAGLSKMLGILVLGICGLVFALGVFRGQDLFQMFLVAVSLAVAAIPEGLPAIVTIVLSLGMGRMAEKNAIVKKLLAVETLGTTTVICSDKTGTLTQNQMTVTKFFTNMKSYLVEGSGYEPKGRIILENVDNVDKVSKEANNDSKVYSYKHTADFNLKDITNYPQINFECGKDESVENAISLLLSMSVLNNDAKLNLDENQYKIMGDPTEASLLTLGGKIGFDKSKHNLLYPRIEEIPFDSNRKMMSTFHSNFVKDKIVSITKGATDSIVERCSSVYIDGHVVPINEDIKRIILQKTSEYSLDALRVLGFAIKLHDALPEKISDESVENNMIFVGIVGMIDPPREEVKLAIEECVSAGITTIMITGDHIDTAFAIAKELGIASNRDEAMLGSELNTLSDDEIREVVKHKRVFARVSPQNKVQIVDALKLNENITAMTGDGVNDAPAIKKADIGIAMGITGTDVAKNTAEVILTDDNFATIVNAVEEGRIIYSNIKKFVSFLLSCNIGEILIMLFAILVNLPIPFLPTQLLWLNLVTDSFPALALGVEKGEKGIMDEKPRESKEAILDRETMLGVISQSIAIAISALSVYYIAYKSSPSHIEYARTMAFVTLICAELLRSYSVRSSKSSLLSIGIFSNKLLVAGTALSFVLMLVVIYVPFMASIFKTVTLGLMDWAVVLPFSFLPLIVGELVKSYRIKARAK